MSVAAGEVSGVNHINVGEILCRNTGVLVAGGKIGADVDMNNGITIPEQTGEHLLIIRHIVGSSRTEISACGHMVKDVLWGDIDSVTEGFARLSWYKGAKFLLDERRDIRGPDHRCYRM